MNIEERIHKIEMWLKNFEEDFRKQQIKIDNLFSELKEVKNHFRDSKDEKLK